MRRLCQLLSLILCGLPLICVLPNWAITTWVGGCWGAVLLTGLSNVWTTHRLGWSVYALITAVLAHESLNATTDLGPNANWLVIVLLLGSGWLMGVTLLPWHESRRVPGIETSEEALNPQPLRFSLWDILCATALVAMLCWILPRAENQFDLMCQLAPSLIGGVLLSILALEWAWRDKWSMRAMASTLVSVPIILALTMPWSPAARTLAENMAWIISGPLSVMAAQFMVVLIWVSSLRTHSESPVISSSGCSFFVTQFSLSDRPSDKN